MSAREQVRELIQAELARQHPLEGAQRPLELIAETSVRFLDDGSAGYQVFDDEGRPRTVDRDGVTTEFTIADLVAELREKHPSLFRSGVEPAPASAPPVTAAASDPLPDLSPRQEPSEAHLPRADWRIGSFTPDAAEGTASAPTVSPAITPAPVGQRDWLTLDGTVPVEPRSAPVRLEAAPRAPSEHRPAPADHAAPAPLASDPVPSPASQAPRQDVPRSPPPLSKSGDPRGIRVPRSASRRPLPPLASRGPARWVYAGLAGVAVLGIARYVTHDPAAPPPAKATASAAQVKAKKPAVDPATTGSVTAAPKPADPTPVVKTALPGPVSGATEVLDTTTLRVDGKVVRLFGVDWARGGQGEDLARYLNGRPVSCQPAEGNELYHCAVEGRDLSQVVLYNGGARATPSAPPELVAAEDHARTEHLGVWRK